MPMIDVTYVRGSLEQQALERLTDELVTALLRAEQAPDTLFLRDNTLVYLHELGPAAQSVGGRDPGAPRFRDRHGLRGRLVLGRGPSQLGTAAVDVDSKACRCGPADSEDGRSSGAVDDSGLSGRPQQTRQDEARGCRHRYRSA